MTNTNNMINYWRNSLADAARMNIDAKKLEDAFAISKSEMQVGMIDGQIADKIFIEASRTKKKDTAYKRINRIS